MVHVAVIVLVTEFAELLFLGGDPLRLVALLVGLVLVVHVADVLGQRDLAVSVLRGTKKNQCVPGFFSCKRGLIK